MSPSVRGAVTSLLMAAALLTTQGCGGSEHRVEVHRTSGTVTRGGKPFPHAIVQFYPVAPPTTDPDDPASAVRVAESDDQGHFYLSTYTANDGAPAGEYAVTVRQGGPPDAEQRDGPAPPAKVDPALAKYGARDTSPFKATVKAGDNSGLNFDIK